VLAARRLRADLRRRGVQRLAIVTGDGIADREFEGMLLGLIGTGQPRTITRLAAPAEDDDDPEAVADVAEELAEADPQLVVYAAADGPRTRAAVAAIEARLPGVPVALGPQARSERCARALGGRAMRLALDAIDDAGPDRAAVVRAAKAAERLTPCR
jgi:hypothetical protein